MTIQLGYYPEDQYKNLEGAVKTNARQELYLNTYLFAEKRLLNLSSYIWKNLKIEIPLQRIMENIIMGCRVKRDGNNNCYVDIYKVFDNTMARLITYGNRDVKGTDLLINLLNIMKKEKL